MFSEDWLEKHGNAPFQDLWTLTLNWTILCLADKKDLLMDCINKIKSAAGKILWLPYIPLDTT
jgi:hypothetical protein